MAFLVFLFTTLAALATEPSKPKGPTMAEVLAASKPADWRPLEPENTLCLELTD